MATFQGDTFQADTFQTLGVLPLTAVTVEEIRAFLRIIHTDDDDLLQILIYGAEDEAKRFCNRTQLPTLPLEYPPRYDSSSSLVSEEVPSSEDPIAPSVRIAIYYLVQSKYEGTKPEDVARIRQAAETLLWPYRTELGG